MQPSRMRVRRWGWREVLATGGILLLAFLGCSCGGGGSGGLHYLLTITPNPAVVEANGPLQFIAVVKDPEGLPILDVELEWTASPAELGTIDETGLLLAGSEIGLKGTVTVRAPKYRLEAVATVEIVEPQRPPGPTGNVSGKVTDGSGQPLAGATVSAYEEGNPTPVDTATTSELGQYSLWLPSGSFTLRVEREGFQPKELPLTLESQNLRVTVPDLSLLPAAGS